MEEDFISKEEYKKILDLINKLPEPHKKRFKMFFMVVIAKHSI